MTAIATPTTADVIVAPQPSGKGHDVSWWGMVLLCATEGTFFIYCITTYFYLGIRNPAWPPSGIEKPALHLPIIMTIVLVASSLTLVWGERGMRQKQMGRFWVGLLATILLGCTFLMLQRNEYQEKLMEFVPQTHAYTSIFFTTTGFHGAHVAFGLLMLFFVGLRAFVASGRTKAAQAVKLVSVYWHFVDAVWLVIFTSFYLSPHLY